MKRLAGALLLTAVVLLAIVAALPGVLYWAALARLDTLPQPGADAALTVEQQNWLRCEMHAGDRDQVSVTDPWTAAYRFLRADPHFSYGDRLSWLVARDHLIGLHGGPGKDTDLSAAPLSVWVARHWTLEQMEARAYVVWQRGRRHECAPGEVPQPVPVSQP